MARWPMLIAVAALGLAGRDKNDSTPDATGSTSADQTASTKDLFDALDDNGDLSDTAGLVKAAGLEKTFEGVGSYTLFAPTNAAIAALPEADRNALKSDEGRVQLLALVSQHLSPGYVGRSDLEQGLDRTKGTVRLATLGGEPIVLSRQGNDVRLGQGDDAPKLVGKPIMARNGVIYPIDKVLPPPK